MRAATKAKPRYQQLADDLRRAIAAGRFPHGFPTESALTEQYRVSRFTVREALRTLQGEGLIARRRGSGTIVQPAAARGGALHQPLSNVGELLQYVRNSRFDFRAIGEGGLPPELAEQVGAPAGGEWWRYRGVRLPEGEGPPIAVTDVYLARHLGAAVDALRPSAEPMFAQLARAGGFRVARVTQDIQACPATAELAATLDVARRSPTLRILRCYFDERDRLFEVSASHHPGERFAYSMHIEVDG